MKLKIPKVPLSKGVSDHWEAEVAQENRRLTGVTPRLVRGWQESPARFLPRAKGLKSLVKSGGRGMMGR